MNPKGVLAALLAGLGAPAAFAAVFTVTTTADAGAGSFRQAILDSNAAPGADQISFSIGSGVASIMPASGLPALTEAVTIDGSTQPGFAGTPLIELVGNQAGAVTAAIDDPAGGSTVRALSIGGFRGHGIHLSGASMTVVEGCYIGLDATGLALRSNHQAGVAVTAGAHRIAGDVIAGQTIGIDIDSTAPGNVVQGNVIGLRVDDVPAGDSLGLNLNAPATIVGGSAPGEGNVVSGHQGDAIHVSAGGVGSVFQGNRIGTDPAGTHAVGNSAHGISIAGADDILIGGAEPGAGNLISGNGGNAIVIHGAGNVVQGNRLGTDAAGVFPIPNGYGIGLGDAAGALVGGTGPGEGNLVAFNLISGVTATLGEGNAIRGNSIHSNGRLAIDLIEPVFVEGPTANDEGDEDEGPNHLQNFPLIHSVEEVAGGLRIEGALRAGPGIYKLDFYADSSCRPRPGWPSQMRVYLGEADVSSSALDAPSHEGEIHFDVTIDAALEAGEVVTATATDGEGNTSEVSGGIVFGGAPRSGSPSGGEPLVVFGTDFASDSVVRVGGVPVPALVLGETMIAAVSPALPAGTIADVSVSSGTGPSGARSHAWVADFLDVPPAHAFHDSVVSLAANGIAAGCGSGNFCVDAPLPRAQAAPLLLRARDGACATPPPCAGVFVDVPCPGPFTDWVEALAASGITAGCGGGAYCPGASLRRDQVSVLLLKARFGETYVPPPCTGAFADVPCPGPFTDWVEDLSSRGFAGGCGFDLFCPDLAVTRGQIAALLTKTFALP